MNDRERLEVIKLAPKYPANMEDFGIIKIYRDDFNYLIEKAELTERYKQALEKIKQADLNKESWVCQEIDEALEGDTHD